MMIQYNPEWFSCIGVTVDETKLENNGHYIELSLLLDTYDLDKQFPFLGFSVSWFTSLFSEKCFT